MKPSTTAERLQEAMNIRGLKQVDVLRLAEPYCRAYGVNLGKTALTQYVSGKIVPRQDKPWKRMSAAKSSSNYLISSAPSRKRPFYML